MIFCYLASLTYLSKLFLASINVFLVDIG